MINKRMLIISNNALSQTNCNGRTLLNLFSKEDKDNLAQFYIRSTAPDFDVCENYFFVSDFSVLKSVLKRKSVGVRVKKSDVVPESCSGNRDSVNKIPRTALTMLARNLFWQSKVWRKEFYQWVENFHPECVLLQAGDSPFMYDISLEIARKYRIPLVIFNTEDYYFKDYNFFKKVNKTDLIYKWYAAVLKKSVRKAFGYATTAIHLHEELQKLFDDEFGGKSTYIYAATQMEPLPPIEEKPIFSYLGNFGYKRYLELAKLAKALNHIDPTYRLDVYGEIRRQEVQTCFDNCKEINYCGVVSYERVKEIMNESLLIFHVESKDAYYCKEVRNGFTTKIADSLACGTCFVVFAPAQLACTKYISNNDCGCVITDDDSLEAVLKDIITDRQKRQHYIANAKEVAKRNHDPEKNRQKMAEIINQL